MDARLPEPQAGMLDKVLALFGEDLRFEAVLGGGSLLHGGFDVHSDLDLVVVVKAVDYPSVMDQREEIAARIGDLQAAFSGEHVGEPRLLICLFGPPLVHVDLKFIKALDLGHLVEMPVVLWAREPQRINASLEMAVVQWPQHDPQWFEQRIWIWLHYAVTKLQRGECFEALGMLAFVREQVLGPMLHRHAGRPQRGVRRLELDDPQAAASLRDCVARGDDAAAIATALRAAIALYLQLRDDAPPLHPAPAMPAALEAMLAG